MLKHLGHANFDDNRSAEFSEAILPLIVVWDDVQMKYGFSLDQKKLHGSYQIVYQQKMAIPTNAEFVGIAIFSPRSWNNSMVGVIKLYALADDHVS